MRPHPISNSGVKDLIIANGELEMEISLIRHGKSKHIDNTRITCMEYKRWVEKYDNSGVVEEEIIPLKK